MRRRQILPALRSIAERVNSGFRAPPNLDKAKVEGMKGRAISVRLLLCN